MGIFRTTIGLTGWGALGSALGYTIWTRKSKVFPLDIDDYIFNTTSFARFNPNNNPSMEDICVRRVPLDKIRPELLEEEGSLVEAFCGGIWSGWGYAFQRRYLERKYRSAETGSDLWNVADLKQSTYDVGTVVTDHFQVIAKNNESIMVRCGDTPRNSGTRENDGIFEMVADVKKEEGVVEFGLKSVFFNGIALPDKEKPVAKPLGAFPWWLHQQYDKVLMETALKNVMR